MGKSPTKKQTIILCLSANEFDPEDLMALFCVCRKSIGELFKRAVKRTGSGNEHTLVKHATRNNWIRDLTFTEKQEIKYMIKENLTPKKKKNSETIKRLCEIIFSDTVNE